MRQILFVLVCGASLASHADLTPPSSELVPPSRAALVSELHPGNLSYLRLTQASPTQTTWTLFYREHGTVELRVNEAYIHPVESTGFVRRWRSPLARVTRRTIRKMIKELESPRLTDPILYTPVARPRKHRAARTVNWRGLGTRLAASSVVGWLREGNGESKSLSLYFGARNAEIIKVKYRFHTSRLNQDTLRGIELEDPARVDSMHVSLKYRDDDEQIRWLAEFGRDRLEAIRRVDVRTGEISTKPFFYERVIDCIWNLFTP